MQFLHGEIQTSDTPSRLQKLAVPLYYHIISSFSGSLNEELTYLVMIYFPQYWIYVWSDENLMDQPTIRTIYNQLDAICADPADLIFLNTFRMFNIICTVRNRFLEYFFKY